MVFSFLKSVVSLLAILAPIVSPTAVPCYNPLKDKFVFGEIESYVYHNDTSNEEINQLILRYTNCDTNMTTSTLIRNNPKTSHLVTGDTVKLGIRRRATDIFNPTGVDIITATETSANRDFVIQNKPVNITSITMLATVCGQKPKLTFEQIKLRYFNKFAPTGFVTLENMHSVCSYNKLLFTPANNVIVDNINIPCNGIFNGAAYNSSRCDTPELYGWINEALKQAKAQGFAVEKYKRKILLLPTRPKCPWSGLASVGCSSSCNTWINLGAVNYVDNTLLFHEMGHNIGLMHSNRNISWVSAEYGDCTDPMGCGGPMGVNKTMTCMSAPQQFKAGWATMIDQGFLDLNASFTPAVEYLRTLPAIALTDMNMIRLRISSLPVDSRARTPQEHALFISYRVRQPAPGFDSGLKNDMNQRVFIHSYNLTIQSQPRPDPSGTTAYKPTVIAVLDLKPAKMKIMKEIPVTNFTRYWFEKISMGIHIHIKSKTPTQAVIGICKFVSQNENTKAQCTDGLDNDCNGLIDAGDPACWSVLGTKTEF